MDLELHFQGLGEDLRDGVAEVVVADLAVADDVVVSNARTGAVPLTVSPRAPSVRLQVDLPALTDAYRPGVIVRVRGHTRDGEQREFLNTTATPLGRVEQEVVEVFLERIS